MAYECPLEILYYLSNIFFSFKSDEEKEDEENSKDEDEDVASTTKPVISKKNAKKAVSKSLNQLQAAKGTAKKASKKQKLFKRGTAKSKRSKHYNPKKIVPKK